ATEVPVMKATIAMETPMTNARTTTSKRRTERKLTTIPKQEAMTGPPIETLAVTVTPALATQGTGNRSDRRPL
ncbi:MAG: hypothetical protein V5A36_07605, partial [Natronomonas sp.]